MSALTTRLNFRVPRFRTRARLFYTIFGVLLTAFAVVAALRRPPLMVFPIHAAPREAKFPPARLSEEFSIRSGDRRNSSLGLRNGHDLLTTYQGPEMLQRALLEGQAAPRALASADFDEDGVPDLVSGYAWNGQGIVTLLRGNVDSIYPNAPEAKQRKADGTFTEAPFLSPANAFPAPVAADFIGAGDFDADGHWDVVAASRSANALYLLSGDGHGGLQPAREIVLPGPVSAMTYGEINRQDGLADIVVGVDGPEGPTTMVFEGPEGALNSQPETFALSARATAFALGQFDDHYEFDLAVAAGNRLELIRGRDRKLSLDSKQQATVRPASREARTFDFTIRSMVAGNFGGDSAEDLALLSADGRVYYLNQTRTVPARKDAAGPLLQWQIENVSGDVWPNATQILSAHVSTAGWDDLVVPDPSTRKLHALSRVTDSKFQTAQKLSTATASPPRVTSFDVVGDPVTTLPMRLDVDGLSDLVVLQSGSSAPTIMQTLSGSREGQPGVSPEGSGVFSNLAPIAINASGPFAVGGTPYPSTITVAGFTGSLDKVRIRLANVTKSFANDTDFLVVGPGGQKVLVLSHYFAHLSNANLTFDDAASAPITAPACCVTSGTYKPTVTKPPPSALPTPAPAGPYGSVLSAFAGADPNGTWSLYVANNNSITGTVAGGWEVILNDPPPTTFIVTNTNDSGTGSLRQAILDANQKVGPDIITFNIQPSGAHTIAPASALPDVTDVVTIDGTTQPGFVGVPLIEIDGTNTGGFAGTLKGVLNMKAGNSVVRGLVINRYNTDAIALLTLGNNIVEGNFIGTDLTGTLDRGNQLTDGITLDSPNNLIGGTTSAARNVISGIAEGVVLAGPGTNLVQGNFIGTNLTGDAQIANSHSGVTTRSAPGSPNNVVGGTTAGARNIISAGISATGVDVVYAASNGALVQGNYIGTDVTGTKPFGPFAGTFTGNNDGVDLTGGAHDVTIGGTTPAARNIISGNFIGLEVVDDNTVANLIQGNFVGTNVNGTAAIANSKGIFFLFDATANTIGGATAAARNIISGNTQHGIHFGEPLKGGALNNVVQQNFIGTDVTGDAPIPNGRTPFFQDNDCGILIPANSRGDKIIQNRIAYNKGAGIRITNVTGNDTDSIEIEIADNLIYANQGLGIDLGAAGITPNDPLDVDDGPNRLQNFPVLTSAAPATPPDSATREPMRPDPIEANALTINGTLNSTPNTTFTVHWYFSGDAQCVTNQAGSRPLVFGKVPGVTTDNNGNAPFNFPFDFPAGITGGIINCTATDPVGNTSEFSACLAVGSGAPSPTPTPTPSPAVQLGATSYSTTEGIGSKTLTVTRTGNTSGAATVDYATSDTAGSNCGLLNTSKASSRCDYIATMGTLKFAANETSKTILIPIIDDAYAEGDESFTVTLSNATGVALGTPSSATVTITDNESTNGTNQINDARYYVRVHYLDFLNREPDTSGWDFWTNQITSCGGSDAGCIEVRRINVSVSFFLSIEFQQTGYLIERIYKVAYGDADGTSTFPSAHQLKVPIVRLNEFLADSQQIQQGVIVNQGNWQQQLEDNKVAFALGFVQRPRFTTAFPTTLTPAQFVDALNVKAGNVLSASERTTAINLFSGAGNTTNQTARAQAVRQVAEDADLNTAEFNRAFVLMQYFGYLRRNPDDPQDTDYTGYDFWLTKLNQFNGNYIDAEMVKAFITSIEYKGRFGP